MTLLDARNLLDQLIAEQGESAPCAAYIYTKNDVVTYDEEDCVIAYSDEVANEVLRAINDSADLYVYFNNFIEDAILDMN